MGSIPPLAQALHHDAMQLHQQPDYALAEYDLDDDPLWTTGLQPQPFDAIAWYQCDHLGTPQELTDEHGEIVWSAHYKAWGQAKEVISDAARKAGIQNPLRFQGQYFDHETGLHYNRHRYYDPSSGRFISKDPIGLAGGLNVYQYAPNTVQWIDPLGLARTSSDGARRYLFSLKHRPIRLNRKTRRIYAMRTKDRDGLWEVRWSNDEFFCIGKRRVGGLSTSYSMYDIRHYTLDADGNVVRGFVLGRLMFSLEQAQQQWEYYRRYMQDGPADLPEPHRFWNPRESFWEGFKICREDKLSSLFSSLFDYVFFPFMLLDATVRWLVLATCSAPVWPAEIEAACKPEPNDPYARPYADDYIGFASGLGGKPSRADLERAWALEPQRRREGALTRSEAEAILKQQKSQAVV